MRARIAIVGLVCSLSALVATVGTVSASTMVYTNEASFAAQLGAGYYLEDFNYAPWTTIVDPAIPTPQPFAGGDGWAYQISSPRGLSGQPIPPPNGPGGAVANYFRGDPLTITFDAAKMPTAVGGIFWLTDQYGNFVNNGTVTITLANAETFTYTDTSNWNAFTGFISDSAIASMTLTSGNFATMDHFYVGSVYAPPVPEPSTLVALLSLGGMGLVGLIRRRRAAA